MYMGKIEAAAETKLLLPDDQRKPEQKGAGGMLLGIGFLLVAIPYWSIRLLAHALWHDVRRAGRAAKMAGETYAEALRGR